MMHAPLAGRVDIHQVGIEQAPALYPIFRSATPDHPDAPARGFLLSRYDDAGFAAFLARCKVYAAAQMGAYVGFVVVEAVAFQGLKGIDWHLSTEQLRSLAETDLQWIRMLAVLPRVARRGIGTALYHTLFTEYGSSDLLTGLYERPLDNRASRQFHLNLGFRRVGESRLQRADESTERQTGIYYRPA